MRFDFCRAICLGILLVSVGCEEERGIHKVKAKTTLPIQYKQPEGWRRSSVPKQLSLLTLYNKNDDVEITISKFDGDGGGLAPNVNRWRRQSGLPPLAAKEVEESVTKKMVGGYPGSYVDLVGKGNSPDRLLGVIVPRDGATWFFKLKGPIAAASAEKKAFDDTFLESVKFNGANDG